MKTLNIVLAATLALAGGSALAKTHKMATPMHCMMADGTMDMKMSKKACMAGKGTWTKHSATMPMGDAGMMPMSNSGSMAPMAPMAPMPRK